MPPSHASESSKYPTPYPLVAPAPSGGPGAGTRVFNISTPLPMIILPVGFRLYSPLAKCGCKKFCMDFHGDHTSTCTAHSGATKAHDWMVSVLGPWFRTAGHTVRTEHGVTAKAV